MKWKSLLVAGALLLSHASSQARNEAPIDYGPNKISPPLTGAYHGAYPDFGPAENDVTPEKIADFTRLAGKNVAWAYFSDHWINGEIIFPTVNVEVCRRLGLVPYIRMSPWSVLKQNQPDPIFSMEAILSGRFDSALRAWARSARATGIPIMVEFGPEANGSWFPWNGKWNGGGRRSQYGDPKWPDGPERFRDAYRHVIDIFRDERAFNVTWVLHIDANWWPEDEWNQAKYYYPGDDYIDWIGISVFGPQLPKENWRSFSATLRDFWSQVEDVSKSKPVLISEFAVMEDLRHPGKKAGWIREALDSISRGNFPRVKGVTYWHSPGWRRDRTANLRIDSSRSSLDAYRTEIRRSFWRDTARSAAELSGW